MYASRNVTLRTQLCPAVGSTSEAEGLFRVRSLIGMAVLPRYTSDSEPKSTGINMLDEDLCPYTNSDVECTVLRCTRHRETPVSTGNPAAGCG